MGLVEMPKLTSYGGLIFGCWDSGAGSLDDYLGDYRWYLDIMLSRLIGGMTFIRGQQRYKIGANWKIAAENFAGDTYHLGYSHASVFKLGVNVLNPVSYQAAPSMYSVVFPGGHGMTSLAIDNERYDYDLRAAQGMGAEVVEYVREARARLDRECSPVQSRIYALGFGNIFPNVSVNDFSALRPIGFYVWHPRGPSELEVWQWCAVDAGAPDSLIQMIRDDFARNQAAAGTVAPDDGENFEQVTEATRGVVGRRQAFNYQMGMGDIEEIRLEGVPGKLAPYYSELGQRNFYTQWATLLNSED